MELVLKGFHWKICLIYLDDVIVKGRTFEEELERLEQVFERLAWAGLKLKPKKCFLFQKWVSYPGHVITEEGISADRGKVEQVRTWPIPENRTEVKSFLELTSYYRRFIPDFSTVAQPLYKLTDAKTDFVWKGECQVVFNSLKSYLHPLEFWPTRPERGSLCWTPTHQTMELVQSCHSFKAGWKDLLHLQVEHCPSLRGTIV